MPEVNSPFKITGTITVEVTFTGDALDLIHAYPKEWDQVRKRNPEDLTEALNELLDLMLVNGESFGSHSVSGLRIDPVWSELDWDSTESYIYFEDALVEALSVPKNQPETPGQISFTDPEVTA